MSCRRTISFRACARIRIKCVYACSVGARSIRYIEDICAHLFLRCDQVYSKVIRVQTGFLKKVKKNLKNLEKMLDIIVC